MIPAPLRFLAILLALPVVSASLAGQPPLGARPPGEAIEAGPLQVQPAVIVRYGYDDNLLFRSEEFETFAEQERETCLAEGNAPASCPALRPVFQDQFIEVEPTVAVRLPFSQSYAEVTYRPSLLRYRTFEIDDEISQGVDADLGLRTGSGDQLRLQGRYDRGLVELETLDQGGESSFDAQGYRSAEGRAVYRRSPGQVRGIEARLSYVSFRFDNVEARSFSDFDTIAAGVGYYVDYGTETTWSALLEASDVDRTFTGGTSQAAGLETWAAGVGVARGLAGDGRLTARLLVTHLRGFLFDRDASSSADPEVVDGSTFTGVQMDVTYTDENLRGDELSIRLRHRPVQSFFFNNEYFLSTGIVATWQREIGRGWVLALEARGLYNDYRVALDDSSDVAGSVFGEFDIVGVKRADYIYGGSAALQWPLARRATWAVGVSLGRRSSNIPLVDYEQTSVFTQVTLGWN